VFITVVTPYLPYPEVAHGGGQDLYRAIRALGERHEIRVVTFVDNAQVIHAEALRPYLVDLCLVWPAIQPGEKLKNVLKAVKSGRIRSIGRRADREVKQALQERPSDVVHCAWTEMGRYLVAAPPGSVRVLEEVDVRFLSESNSGMPGARLMQRKQEEIRYCRAADLVVTRSTHDLEALRKEVPGLNGLVIPPVAHVDPFLDIDPAESVPGRVLFVGALSRRRNQEAVFWLVGEIWPRVRETCPGAQLRIVGADPPAPILALDGTAGVRVTGYVADLGQEYAEARVVVAPMRAQAGALNKVLDGLAAGRPVVGTTAANSGIAAPAGVMVMADDTAAFASGITAILRDPSEWDRKSAAGRQHVRQHFRWHDSIGRYEAVLRSLVAARRMA
jgi:glycosyltransferase involved in cell wall biosynthesis